MFLTEFNQNDELNQHGVDRCRPSPDNKGRKMKSQTQQTYFSHIFLYGPTRLRKKKNERERERSEQIDVRLVLRRSEREANIYSTPTPSRHHFSNHLCASRKKKIFWIDKEIFFLFFFLLKSIFGKITNFKIVLLIYFKLEGIKLVQNYLTWRIESKYFFLKKKIQKKNLE